jgi:hypothetical protein
VVCSVVLARLGLLALGLVLAVVVCRIVVIKAGQIRRPSCSPRSIARPAAGAPPVFNAILVVVRRWKGIRV